MEGREPEGQPCRVRKRLARPGPSDPLLLADDGDSAGRLDRVASGSAPHERTTGRVRTLELAGSTGVRSSSPLVAAVSVVVRPGVILEMMYFHTRPQTLSRGGEAAFTVT